MNLVAMKSLVKTGQIWKEKLLKKIGTMMMVNLQKLAVITDQTTNIEGRFLKIIVKNFFL